MNASKRPSSGNPYGSFLPEILADEFPDVGSGNSDKQDQKNKVLVLEARGEVEETSLGFHARMKGHREGRDEGRTDLTPHAAGKEGHLAVSVE